MNLLVLAPRAVDANDVRSALPGEDLEGARVLVVTPALNSSPLAFWMSDSDEAIADAEDAASKTVAALGDAGVRARGTTGESEPLTALQDALATFPAEKIVVFISPEDEQRYREDDLTGEATRRFGVPVVEQRLS